MARAMAVPGTLSAGADLVEVVFGGTLEADEIVRKVPQPEDLSPGEPAKIGKDGDSLLPMVANPGQRKNRHAKMIPAQMFQQALGRSAGTPCVGDQFGTVAGDVHRVGG